MNAVMPDQSTNNVAEFFSPGPGERLRAARLSMGYDLAKIASELHLTSPVVEALEADQFDEIGARVFVRGYLRNYARIVGMPVDSILRQFDEKWPDEDAHKTVLRQSPRLPADGGPSRGWAGALTWLVLLAVVVLFLMWWRGYLDEIMPEQIRTSSSAELAAVDADGADADDLLAIGEDTALADGSLRLPAPPSDLPAEGVETSSTAGGDELALPAVVTTPQTEATGASETQVPTVSSEPAPSAATPVEPPAATAPAQSVVATPVDGGTQGAPVVDLSQQIVMTFSGPCWVDVRDSERKFKLFGEMPQGARRVLGGKPPYKMVIGNANVVTITVNGRPFDLRSYAKGNVARFTLDP